MEDEEGSELEGVLVPHDLASAKDDYKVSDGQHGDLGLGRQGRCTFLKDERVDGLSARDECISLDVVVVELDAEGLVDAEVDFFQELLSGHGWVCLLIA